MLATRLSLIRALVAFRRSSLVLVIRLSLSVPKFGRAMPFARHRIASECDVGFERYRMYLVHSKICLCASFNGYKRSCASLVISMTPPLLTSCIQVAEFPLLIASAFFLSNDPTLLVFLYLSLASLKPLLHNLPCNVRIAFSSSKENISGDS